MSGDQGIYRRVSVRLWADERVRCLSPLLPSAQALWLYLLTGPHTGVIPGVFTCGRAAMAEALNWSQDEFSRCLAEIVGACMAEYDHSTRLWFIPNAIRHNPPASPNVVRGWRAAWVLLPEGTMRSHVADGIASALEGLSEAFQEAFREAVAQPSAKPLPRALPNQEQEQEQEKESARAPRLPADRGSRLSADWTLPDEWRAWAEGDRPDLDPYAVANRFRDYWSAQPGANGRKTNWQATWRNWVRNERAAGSSNARTGTPSTRHAALDCEEQIR